MIPGSTQRLIGEPCGIRELTSPSPLPSPLGRGRIIACLSAGRALWEYSTRGRCGFLSLRERVRVRLYGESLRLGPGSLSLRERVRVRGNRPSELRHAQEGS